MVPGLKNQAGACGQRVGIGSQSVFGGNQAASFIDPAGRYAESAGQRILRQSERLHKLLQEDFTRMNGFLVCFHLFPLVINHSLTITHRVI